MTVQQKMNKSEECLKQNDLSSNTGLKKNCIKTFVNELVFSNVCLSLAAVSVMPIRVIDKLVMLNLNMTDHGLTKCKRLYNIYRKVLADFNNS